jgi:hypothetical protein
MVTLSDKQAILEYTNKLAAHINDGQSNELHKENELIKSYLMGQQDILMAIQSFIHKL